MHNSSVKYGRMFAVAKQTHYMRAFIPDRFDVR